MTSFAFRGGTKGIGNFIKPFNLCLGSKVQIASIGFSFSFKGLAQISLCFAAL